ncbi:entericidin B signal peptide protein [Rhizobium sp. CG5]|uniref:entericidin domain-containing protein n=1 Tax=Rhizobium sp. CG5 TaxID=2726076 RepID=UPI0020335E58|nr:entericidin B signal peptide protein [Rhizobium sp. CG5]MCM2474694.1 entericidin B signal peptide protein [Rhizobium sp. CG5]
MIARTIGLSKAIVALAVIGVSLLSLSGCGNTIRGVGRDVGAVVDATQDAGHSVANSVK